MPPHIRLTWRDLDAGMGQDAGGKVRRHGLVAAQQLVAGPGQLHMQ